MRPDQRLGRYILRARLSTDPGLRSGYDVQLWRAYDTILDRTVAIRAILDEDPRVNAVLGAAQAAAMVDDRRLLRVLDILSVTGQKDRPGFVCVVSEWARGENLDDFLAARGGEPWEVMPALDVVAHVARTLAACLGKNVAHGRLRPSRVFITDAGEVRIRGLAVDAALFGTSLPEATPEQADVDALGCLTYLLTTGLWPGAVPVNSPEAPRSKGLVLPPSKIRANLTKPLDDIIARSVASAARARDVARVPDAAAFATMISATLDHLAPVTTTIVPVPRKKPVRNLGRALTIAVSAAGLVVVAVAGVLLARPSIPPATQKPATDAMLTASAQPAPQPSSATDLPQTFPIIEAHSYNPFGTKFKSQGTTAALQSENESSAPRALDEDPESAWLTRQYNTPDLAGKGGAGLVLDLGQPRTFDSVSLKLVGSGSDVAVKVSNSIPNDPALWKPFAAATAASGTLDLRVPQPVTARYVLVWFTRLPSAANASGKYQGGVRGVTVSNGPSTTSQ